MHIYRSIFAAGCLLGVLPAGSPASALAENSASVLTKTREQLFDSDWRFFRGDAAGAENPGFDDSVWRVLDLPHDWSIEDAPGAPAFKENWSAPLAMWEQAADAPEKAGPFDRNSGSKSATGWTVGGTGWYRKRFTVSENGPGQQFEIRFDGVYKDTEVWLNGALLGSQHYGYTSFVFDLTPHLKQGVENVLAVRVRNEGVTSRWYSGSGIYRHVWLRETGMVRIPFDGLFITSPDVSADSARVQVSIELENRKTTECDTTVAVELFDQSGNSVGRADQPLRLSANGSGKVEFAFSLTRPSLWAPAHPALYRAEVLVKDRNAISDCITSLFGVRKTEIDAKSGLRVNGESLKLKGACVHHDNGFLGAVAIDRAEIRRVELLKANGFNAIRSSHNPPSPAFLDACDRLGMLVIDEVFDVWEVKKKPDDYHRDFSENWRFDLASIVRRDRNHPSVILWSIGNEIPERATPHGVEIARMLREEVLRHDSTRPITAAIHSFGNWEAWEKIQVAFQELDVAGYNYLYDRYEPDHERFPERVMVGMESYAAESYLAWKRVEAHPYVIGDFVWTALDYLGEAGIIVESKLVDENSKPRLGLAPTKYPYIDANCGDIDLVGAKRPASFYRDVVWNRSLVELFVQRPTPLGMREVPMRWGWFDELKSWTWPGEEARPLKVRAYTKGDEVRLLLNGENLGTRKPDEKITAGFDVPYQPGTLTAIAYVNGKEIGRQTLTTVGVPAQVRLRADRVEVSDSRNDLAFVQVEVVDREGNLVPDAAVPLIFTVTGDAELAAAGSANPRAVESFKDDRCHAFHGMALAIVRPLGRAGSAKLEVSALGLRGDSIEFSLRKADREE